MNHLIGDKTVKSMTNWPLLHAVNGLVLIVACSGCATAPNANGSKVTEIDPSVRGPVASTGIESQDIMAMTDMMMRDLMSTPSLAKQDVPPRIVMDSSKFINESTQAINKNLIVDRLRVGLNRAAKGRMMFLSRENLQAVKDARDAKREGLTDVGTTGLAKAVAGEDYALTGRIASADSRNNKSGMQQRYMQITFEILDMETGAILWSNQYEFAKAAADDVVYR